MIMSTNVAGINIKSHHIFFPSKLHHKYHNSQNKKKQQYSYTVYNVQVDPSQHNEQLISTNSF